MKRLYTAILCGSFASLSWGQDFIRAGVGFTPDSSNVLGTFSFDLNRSESTVEEDSRHFLYTKHWYILPSIDMNIGRDVASSNNNVLVSLKTGYTIKIDAKKKLPLVRQKIGFELSPTFQSDKNFKERLFYITPKVYHNLVSSKKIKYNDTDQYVKREFVIGSGISGNIGQRISQIKDSIPVIYESNLYSVAGGFLEISLKLWKLKSDDEGKLSPVKTWSFSLTGIGYGIIRDHETLTNKKFIHYLKLSIDRQIIDEIEVNFSYKHGSDNPFYTQTHIIETGIKIGFGIFE